MVTRWSRSTSNFYALIGENLTGELMRKIYAASWNLFNLATEADRVLCQFVMFLSKVSFSTGCTKWNIAALKSLLLFIHHNNKDFKPRVLFLEEKGVRLISLSFL